MTGIDNVNAGSSTSQDVAAAIPDIDPGRALAQQAAKDIKAPDSLLRLPEAGKRTNAESSANLANSEAASLETLDIVRAKIDQLRSEGIIQGLTVTQQDGKDKIAISLTAQTNPQAPDYDQQRFEAASKRVREALQGVSTGVLKQLYSPRSDQPPANANASLPNVATFAGKAQANLPDQAPRDNEPDSYLARFVEEFNSIDYERPFAGDYPSKNAPNARNHLTSTVVEAQDILIRSEEKLAQLLNSLRSDVEIIHNEVQSTGKRMTQVETKLSGLPSRDFVILIALSILGVLAPMFVLQTKIPSIVIFLSTFFSSIFM